MSEMNEFLKRAANKAGYARVRYVEKDIPADPSQITVMHHFGDMRSTFVLSSLLLRRYREEMKGSKYFILCSWPGQECLFPYVNEYWSIKDEPQMKDLYYRAKGFDNDQDALKKYIWDLNWFFEDVTDYRAIRPYYEDGITQQFFDRFRHVKSYLPPVLSAAVFGEELSATFLDRSAKKVFVYPTTRFYVWRRHRLETMRCPKEFWVCLVKRLLDEGYLPIIGNDYLTYGLSGDLPEKCVQVSVTDMSRMLAVMRHSNCVLDMFFGNSRLALAARAPFVACDERQRFFEAKEYEVDDLCSDHKMPRKYVFSFPRYVLDGGEEVWKFSLIDSAIPKIKEIVDGTDRNLLPSTSESYTITPYEHVRKLRLKKLGTKFIRRTRKEI